jgi:hypothetical protein
VVATAPLLGERSQEVAPEPDAHAVAASSMSHALEGSGTTVPVRDAPGPDGCLDAESARARRRGGPVVPPVADGLVAAVGLASAAEAAGGGDAGPRVVPQAARASRHAARAALLGRGASSTSE